MVEASQDLESRRWRLGRWGAAAIVACALHAGGAGLALMLWQEEAGEVAAGALTVEMAPLLAAAPSDSPNLAHGPVIQDTTAAAQPTEKVVEEEVAKDDIPPIDPSPAPEPEVALPKPQPEEEELKKEEPREEVVEKQNPAEASEQQIATAPPRVKAQPAPNPALSQGLSGNLAREHERWKKGLVARLERFKRYPEAASRRGIKGKVRVRFTVDRLGQVVEAEVVESSGSPILDEEAVALVRRAGPFPPLPDGLPDAYRENFFPYGFE
jgi:protein TonB